MIGDQLEPPEGSGLLAGAASICYHTQQPVTANSAGSRALQLKPTAAHPLHDVYGAGCARHHARAQAVQLELGKAASKNERGDREVVEK